MKTKEIKLETGQIYESNNYPDSGIYLVEDENNGKIYVYVNKGNFSVIFLDTFESGKYILEDFAREKSVGINEIQNNNVSESFALKMLAIASDKVKIKDLEL